MFCCMSTLNKFYFVLVLTRLNFPLVFSCDNAFSLQYYTVCMTPLTYAQADLDLTFKKNQKSRHVCPHIPISDLGMPFGLPHFISNWYFCGFEFPHFSFTFLRMSNFKAPSLIEISFWDAHCKAFHLNAWLPHCLRRRLIQTPSFLIQGWQPWLPHLLIFFSKFTVHVL